MSSYTETRIKELRHLFEKEVIPKLESIDSNLELIAEKLCFPEATIKQLISGEFIDPETKAKLKRL